MFLNFVLLFELPNRNLPFEATSQDIRQLFGMFFIFFVFLACPFCFWFLFFVLTSSSFSSRFLFCLLQELTAS